MVHKNHPKVTVIIPTLNRLKFISETITSVINQTYENLEIIVSDNGSKVNVKEHINHFLQNDNRVFYRRNDITIPATDHFNQCINLASGKYFIIISDDDFISKNFLEALVMQFEKNPKLSLGITSNVQIDEYGFQKVTLPSAKWVIKPGYQFLNDWLLKNEINFIASFISAFTLTDFIKKTGGHPCFNDASHSDNAVAINLSLQGDVVFVEEAIFYYRVYNESFGLSLSYKSLAKASKDLINFYNSFDFHANNSFLDLEQITLIKLNIRKMAWKTYLTRLVYVYNLRGINLINAIFYYELGYVELNYSLNQIINKALNRTTFKRKNSTVK